MRRARQPRAWRAPRWLLLGGCLGLLPLAAPTATAQPAPAGSRGGSGVTGPGADRVRDAIDEQAAARVAATVCSRRVVLLGELPEHGEGRGMEIKARIVEQLVTRCGFRAVLFEAGSYDFFGLERAIAAARRGAAGSVDHGTAGTRSDSLELALARAIGGLWWTRELGSWRQWLVQEALAGRVGLGGLDDQLGATAAYARATLPALVGSATPPARAAACRASVARYLSWGYTTAEPYDAAERARLAECARLAAAGAGARGARAAVPQRDRRTPDDIMLEDLASYFARARADADRGAPAAADRDQVMARHIAWWSKRLPPDARLVVWTATTHAARATRGAAARPRGVSPVGAQLAGQWGDQLAAIGFTALQGEWSRAGQPAQPLAALPPQALEAQALAGSTGGKPARWAYLDRTALRSLGAVPSRLFGNVVTADWSTAFDGVLVVRDERPPTAEPRR